MSPREGILTAPVHRHKIKRPKASPHLHFVASPPHAAPLFFTMRLLLLASLITALPLQAAPLRFTLAGDSTVATAANPPKDRPDLAGWGQHLADFLSPECAVINHARSGTSTKSFRDLGLWDRVLAEKADWVLIQFGHNDQPGKGPQRETDPAGSYRDNLRRFIQEARAAGSRPVLVTSVARRTFENGRLVSTLPPYVEAVIAVGRETNVPVVDLHRTSSLLFDQRGEKFSQGTYGPSPTDRTHFNHEGARMMARLVAEGLAKAVPELADVLRLTPTPPPGSPFRLQLDTITRGYDGTTCWVHPRAGIIPGPTPSVVLTLQKLLLSGSDIFYGLNDIRSDDLGRTWSTITPHEATLGRRTEPNDVIVAASDFTPKWHAHSGKLLGIGHTVRYLDNKVIPIRRRETMWSVYDADQRTWSNWQTLKMPDDPKFYNCGAGCVQRVDLDNGEILLPVYFKGEGEKFNRTTVLRCSFDGNELRYLGQGNELTLESGRGVYEPSLTRFQGRFYLTLRNDTDGYVAVSDDGLNFGPIQPWRYTDGSPLGTYNTQQHWITRPDALYLVYTRSGAHNDHVVRHRAPLFMARVDPDSLAVIRETETVVVPERGARLGNFGITEVSENETWITVAEWMQAAHPNVLIPTDNAFGADNSVYAARLFWSPPADR